MRNMINMELRNLFKEKLNIGLMIFCIAVSLFMGAYLVGSSRFRLKDNTVSYRGTRAIHEYQQQYNKLRGPINEDVLLRFNEDAKPLKLQEDFSNELNFKYYPIIFTINLAKKTSINSLKNDGNELTKPIEKIDIFNYKDNIRKNLLTNIISSKKLDPEYTDFLIDQISRIRLPFNHYPSLNFDSMIDLGSTLNTMLSISLLILSSQLFYVPQKNNEILLFATYKYGRKKLITAKLLAMCIVSSIMYVISILLYTLPNTILEGLASGKTSVNILYENFLFNYNIFNLLLLQFIMGMIGVSTMIGLLCLLYWVTKKLILSLISTISIIILTLIAGLGSNSILLKWIYILSPASGLSIFSIMKESNVSRIGGTIFFDYPIAILMNVISFIVIIVLLSVMNTKYITLKENL